MSVSRVLRDPPTVAEPLRSRIEKAIAQLNYVPNRAAQMLSAASQFRVGLLYNHPRSAYAADLLLGAMEQAATTEIQLLVRSCMLAEDDLAVLQELLSQRVDAIILTPPLCEAPDLIRLLDEVGMLTVSIATDLRPAHGIAMHIDEFAAAYEMTRHLVELGHARVGFIEGGRAISASMHRLAGYSAALADTGTARDDGIVVPGLFTYRSGLAAAEQLLTLGDPPTAIFASNDDMAAATVATAHRLGLDVPGDVTVCGFDDSWIATSIWPELTTVRQPVATMGARAVSFVRDALSVDMRMGSAPPNTLFPYEVVFRGSHGAVPSRLDQS